MTTYNPDSEQTAKSFEDKWNHHAGDYFEATLNENLDIYQWIMRRNGFDDPQTFAGWFQQQSAILDAGCGNGRITKLIASATDDKVRIVGVDLVAHNVASQNLASFKNVEIFQGDLLGELNFLGRFSLIYCQEVLHHTPDPRSAFLNLASLLDDQGEIAIYVYKKKGPLREFADDYIREQISSLDFDQSLVSMRQVTEFARVLRGLDIEIDVPSVDLLEISAGKQKLHDVIYNFMFKNFWNDDLTFDENVGVNYDWYHPSTCSRHTLEEVLRWYEDAELDVIHKVVDPYGITIRGVRRSSVG